MVSKLTGGLKTLSSFNKKSKSGKPLVSVITVCLNSEKYIEQTIQSVINQTYDNIEYIIIDGGSTDKTLDIIRKYEERIDYWVSEPDKGIYDAMNKGISFADGEWVGIINSDDFYVKDTVKLVVEASRTDKEAQLFYGNLIKLDSRESDDLRNCRECKGQADNMLESLSLNHPTCFVSSKIYAKLKFNTRFRIAADWDFCLRLHFSGIKFGYLNKPLVYFRPGGISEKSLLVVFENYRIRKRYDLKTALKQLCLETRGRVIGNSPRPVVCFLRFGRRKIFGPARLF